LNQSLKLWSDISNQDEVNRICLLLGRAVNLPSKAGSELAIANESMLLVTQGLLKEAHKKLIDYINLNMSKSEHLMHLK
jgi:hypothetical protein